MQQQRKTVAEMPDFSPDFCGALKAAAKQDLNQAKYTPEELAQAISALVGRQVTGEQLVAFGAPGPHCMPLYLVPAWVRVTGSRRILDALQERI